MNLVRSTVVCVSLLLAFPLSGLATQADAPESIDAWLEKAISNEPSTAAVREATNQGRAMWDAEMNSVYSRLMARSPGTAGRSSNPPTALAQVSGFRGCRDQPGHRQ